MAVNTIKKWLLFLAFVFTPMDSLADLEQETFKYEHTEFIIHFTPEGQVYNGRPNSPYDSQHHFSLFYDLLIKYVHRMESFDPAFSIQDIDVWHEMHMVSLFGSQALYVGDHILSDGKSWVAMSRQDYELLSELINDTKKRDKEPVVNDKGSHLKSWIEEVRLSSSGETYEENFKKYEANENNTTSESPTDRPIIKTLPTHESSNSLSSASAHGNASRSSSSSFPYRYLNVSKINKESLSIRNASSDHEPMATSENPSLKIGDLKSTPKEHKMWIFVFVIALIALVFLLVRKLM